MVILAAIGVMIVAINKTTLILSKVVELLALVTRIENRDYRTAEDLGDSKQRADDVGKGTNDGAAADAAARTH